MCQIVPDESALKEAFIKAWSILESHDIYVFERPSFSGRIIIIMSVSVVFSD